MTHKDRWFAANLSWTLPGLGQLYGGSAFLGIAFLVTEAAMWTGWAACVLLPQVSALFLIPFLAIGLGTRILSITLAVRALGDPEAPPGKNPWLSLFLTRLVPGLGYLYARRWTRGTIAIGLLVFSVAWPAPPRWERWVEWGMVLIALGILVDSFCVLRKTNQVGRGPTLALLMAVLLLVAMPWEELVRKHAVESFRVPSGGMAPTLDRGDRIFAAKWNLGTIRRFDVVVHRFSLNSRNYVHRVIGLPGEEIYFESGELHCRASGSSSFVRIPKPTHIASIPYGEGGPTRERPLRIPDDGYYLLGDNVRDSHDSRRWEKHVYVLRSGETVECESQAVVRDRFEVEEIRREHPRVGDDDIVIREDRTGQVRFFPPSEVASHREEPFPFVPRSCIFGRVYKIWWPLSREGPVR